MAKNKATSVDEVVDTIFKEEAWKLLSTKLGAKEKKEIEEKADEIEDTLAENLAEYYNKCLKEKGKLAANQNRLEQIYLQKKETFWKNLDIARPITKTSPFYKLLETIICEKLVEEME